MKKDLGPDVGKEYGLPREKDHSQDEPHCRKSDEDTAFLCEEPPQQEAAGRSPLTDELLPPGENVTGILDYKEDPEVIAPVANIPHLDDVKDARCGPSSGF